MKPVNNPYLNNICSLTGKKEKCAAVAEYVRPHREAGESLHDIARKLGVTRIIEEPLQFDGGVFHAPAGDVVIKLNSRSPSMRKRFTLAHEIGHLLLGKPGLRGACGNDPALERACDLLASELLLPVGEATSYVQSLGQPSPEKLKAIASKYQISVHAAAIRVLSDLQLWKCSAGLWERTPEVRTIWFVGRRRWERSEPSPHALDAALGSRAPVRLTEIWRRPNSSETVWLNLLGADGGRVLGLVAFVS